MAKKLDSEKQNNAIIKKAFERLAIRKDKIVCEALKDIMREALDYALELHELEHLGLHLVMGDDYAWAVVHDGKVEAFDVYTTEDNSGTAWTMLFNYVQTNEVPDTGWVGILMAGMTAAPYKWEKEEDILRDTAFGVVSDFVGKCISMARKV